MAVVKRQPIFLYSTLSFSLSHNCLMFTLSEACPHIHPPMYGEQDVYKLLNKYICGPKKSSGQWHFHTKTDVFTYKAIFTYVLSSWFVQSLSFNEGATVRKLLPLVLSEHVRQQMKLYLSQPDSYLSTQIRSKAHQISPCSVYSHMIRTGAHSRGKCTDRPWHTGTSFRSGRVLLVFHFVLRRRRRSETPHGEQCEEIAMYLRDGGGTLVEYIGIKWHGRR